MAWKRSLVSATALFEPRERFLHPMEMCMLTSSHAFLLCPLQGSLISFPGSENGELFGCRDAARRDDIHWASEFAGRIEFRLFDVLLVVHSFLLSSLSFSQAGLGGVERASERCGVSNAP